MPTPTHSPALDKRLTKHLALQTGLRHDQAEIIQAAQAAVDAGDPPTVHYIVRQWAHVSADQQVQAFHKLIPFYQRIVIRQCKNRLDTLTRNGYFNRTKIDRARHGEGLPHIYELTPQTQSALDTAAKQAG